MIVVVLRFSRPDRRGPVPPKAADRRHALRSARALLLGILLPALLMVLAAPPVLAQINNWGGDVLVSGSSISVAPGESVTYSVRLNRKPTETDGTTLENEAVEWFVMVNINGVRYQDGEYKDLTLIPSFYRSFIGKHDPSHPNDDGNWDEWKGFRIYRASHDDWEGGGKKTNERATSVTLTHEVWDHNANCPVHRRSPVTVGIGGSTPPPDNNGENDGNGESGGGSDNGGNGGNGGNRVAPTASISDATGVEGEVFRFEVTLSRSSDTPVTVDYQTAGGTALEGTDYDAASGTLTFGPGATRQTIEVRTRQDTVVEPNETFTVTLRSPSGATLPDAGAVGTIIDDDASDPAGPALTVSDATGDEGEVFRFEVTLSRSSDTPVTVDYQTAGGTALEGTDYDAASGTLTFEPGATRQTIEVRTRQDTAAEPNETFTVTLNSPSGATLPDAGAVGTIIDDDGPVPAGPALTVSDATGVEGAVLRFEVALSRSSDTPVTVDYQTAGGTALEGTDYDAASDTLTFGPGATRQTIEVRTHQDTAAEPNETFTVTLNSPSGATLRYAGALGTIIDDDASDAAGPALTVSDARAREGEILRFRVILTPPGSETVTVDYQTSSGTAVEGLDYIAAGGRLTFKPGIAQQTVEIQTRKDDIDDSNENLTLWLSNAHGARLQDAVGAGTIIGEVERRSHLVNLTYLPEVGRAIAFNAVRCRIDRALSRAASGNLKQALDRLAPPPSRSVSIDELLVRLSFALQSTGGADGIGRVSAWSCGDYRALADGKSGGPVDWDGKVAGLQAGADVRLRPDLLAGLAVSRSNGTFRYDVVGDAAEIDGRHRLRLNGLHPYLVWEASPHLTVWGTIGHFWGDLEWSGDLEGDRRAGNARLGSAMIGLNGRLLEHGKMTVRLKGETGLAQFKVANAGVGFGAAVSDLRRLRLAIETAHEQPLPTGGTLRPWGEIGLFHDGGDGETGVGFELGGGLRYRNQAKGWSAEVFGRRRMVHGDALPREWGAGAAFRVDPGPADLGFSAILNQSWGRTGSGVERLWDQGPNDAAPSSLWGGRMELQLGYGFGVLGGHGVLTPHGAVTLGQGSGRAYQWGGRLEVGSGVALSLEAERRETDNTEPGHAIMLRGLLRFHPSEASR